MKIIHCSLWGDVELSDIAITIIDTPAFQRLHDIRQNGFAYKVFPTATVSRFAHSIGVYHVTRMVLEHIVSRQPELTEGIHDKRELLCIAGLCHDLGHGPFSHWFDQLLQQHIIPTSAPSPDSWSNHEHRSTAILRHIVSAYQIPISGEDLEFICARILPASASSSSPNWYDTLIHNPRTGIDTDKLDYLLRDVAAFGLQFKYDPMRLIRNSRIIDNHWCFCDRVRDEIQTMFQIRNKMYRMIYLHPTIQKFDQCFSAIVTKNGTLVREMRSVIQSQDCVRFQDMTDAWLIHRLDPALVRHAMCRRWHVFDPFHVRTFVDKQFHLVRNVRYFHRKNPNMSFTIPADDTERIEDNRVSCPAHPRNHDNNDG